MYDLLIMCALRRFFEASTYAGGFFKDVIMMTAGCHDLWYVSTLISINKSILSVDALLSNAFALNRASVANETHFLMRRSSMLLVRGEAFC